METEVSCLRRRLAEEDRGKKKRHLSAVYVYVLSYPSGLEGGGWRAFARAVAQMCVSAEVGSLMALTSRNISNDRRGSEGVTRCGPVFLCLEIKSQTY